MNVMSRDFGLEGILISIAVSITFIFFALKDTRRQESIATTTTTARHQDPQKQQAILQSSFTRPPRAPSRLPNWDEFLKIYYKASLWFYIVMTFKYAIICLLDHNYFAKQRYMSCILVGRFILSPRLAKLMPYAALYVALSQLLWRYIFWKQRPRLKLDFVEFILAPYEQVIFTETEWMQPSSLVSPSYEPSKQSNFALLSTLRGLPASNLSAKSLVQFSREQQHQEYSEWKGLLSDWQQQQQPVGADTFFLSHQFSELPSGSESHLLRPNRDTRAWLARRRAVRLIYMATLGFLILAAPLVFCMAVPVGLTKLGFELSYGRCAEWISTQQAQRGDKEYAYIYTKNRRDNDLPQIDITPSSWSAFFLPLENMHQVNWYHMLRFSCDFVETLFFSLDFLGITANYSLLNFLVALDASDYTKSLTSKVSAFIRLISLQNSLQPHKSSQHGGVTLWMSKGARRSHELEVLIDSLQAMIVDHFKLIREYNQFVASYLAASITVWLAYLLMLAVGQVMPSSGLILSQTSALEWYIMHFLASGYMIVMIGAHAAERVCCLRLHSQLASLNGALSGKCTCKQMARWLTIASYFSGSNNQSCYCFRLFGALNISWLFLLKLFAWVYSALLIASSFYDAYADQRQLQLHRPVGH